MRQEESNMRARAHIHAIRSLLRSPFARLLGPRSWIIWQEPRAQSYAYRPRPAHELYLYPAPGSLADIDAAVSVFCSRDVYVLAVKRGERSDRNS